MPGDAGLIDREVIPLSLDVGRRGDLAVARRGDRSPRSDRSRPTRVGDAISVRGSSGCRFGLSPTVSGNPGIRHNPRVQQVVTTESRGSDPNGKLG